MSRHHVIAMFDRVAKSYDKINRILSFGLDLYWRSRVARRLPNKGDPLLLVDLATGTADQILACRKCPCIEKFIGFDLSEKMLQIGQGKIKKAHLEGKTTLLLGNAQAIPLSDRAADIATISFGIRNTTNPLRTLEEMKRILKSGGRAFILEFSLPKSRIIRFFYLLYLRNLLPKIGKFLSNDKDAYTYLNETIESFPSGEAFLSLMRSAGFSNCTATPLTFGVATLYSATS